MLIFVFVYIMYSPFCFHQVVFFPVWYFIFTKSNSVLLRNFALFHLFWS